MQALESLVEEKGGSISVPVSFAGGQQCGGVPHLWGSSIVIFSCSEVFSAKL
jgi:hypothetical protein